MFRVFQSSSAAERIAAANEFIGSFPAATELLLVGGSREAVDDLVRGFALKARATFGLHRFNLTQLAARLSLGRLAGAGIAPASAIGTQALAARAAFEAETHHQLRYFSPIARFPGFARAVRASIGDLRPAGIPAQKLNALDESGPDNAALLDLFQKQMDDGLLADRTALFDSACVAVRAGAELAKHPMLFLDVPLHSAMERSFVLALAAAAKDGLFTCPAGDLPTFENLKTIPDLVEQRPKSGASGGSSLARLGSHLFSESLPPQSKPDDTVVFFSAPGEERESVEIARRILTEAETGVAFDHMAILVRAWEGYSGLLEAALRRAGLPAYFARGNRRPDPSGRALLALLACAAEDLSARRFAEYLSFAQVPELAHDGTPLSRDAGFIPPEDDALTLPSSIPDGVREAKNDRQMNDSDGPELEGALRAPWKWEQFLVEASVIGGKDRWERRLRGLENQFKQDLKEYSKQDPDSARIAAVERKIGNLRHLRSFALLVIGQLAALPKSATWGEWISALEALIPQVLREPERVLSVMADMKPMAPVASVTLDEVRNVLEEWLANLQPQTAESRYGRVFVASPDQARGRSFDVVFVPGLAERMFLRLPIPAMRRNS
jgi:ATP-dependent helicase/nuclease subunit B